MLSLDWVIGFMEGEATFNVIPKLSSYRHRVTNSKDYRDWAFNVVFKLNQVNNIETLEQIKEFFSSVGINSHICPNQKSKQWGKNANSQDIIVVTKIENCIKIYELIYLRLISFRRKKQVYYWGECAKLINKTMKRGGRGRNTRTLQEFMDIMVYIDKLHEIAKHKGNKIKHSSQSFRELWHIVE